MIMKMDTVHYIAKKDLIIIIIGVIANMTVVTDNIMILFMDNVFSIQSFDNI